MSDVQARGLRFHVQRVGRPSKESSAEELNAEGSSAPIVVFVHGLVMDNLSSFYYTLAAPLAMRGFESVLFDLRGHGLSERPATGYTPEECAQDLVSVLDAIGVTEPVYLVGNSYGGVVAMHAAALAPDRVAGVVLIEAACGGVVGDAWFEDITNTLSVAALGLEFHGTQDQLMAVGQRKVARLAVNADALLNGTTLIDDLASGTKLDLSQVTCPVLGVYGAESELIGAAAELSERIPSCRLHIVSGLGHTVLREATAELLDVLLDWLPS